LKIEYGIRSYVVSDGGVVSRTSPEMRDDLERASDNISGFTQRRCEVSDESRERILTLSHSPSVIKPSQAMGVCRGSRAFKLPMSPMCSRAAFDSVRHSTADTAVKNSVSVMLGVLCPDAFVMCLIYVPKIVQIAIRILLPHFHSKALIS